MFSFPDNPNELLPRSLEAPLCDLHQLWIMEYRYAAEAHVGNWIRSPQIKPLEELIGVYGSFLSPLSFFFSASVAEGEWTKCQVFLPVTFR